MQSLERVIRTELTARLLLSMGSNGEPVQRGEVSWPERSTREESVRWKEFLLASLRAQRLGPEVPRWLASLGWWWWRACK